MTESNQEGEQGADGQSQAADAGPARPDKKGVHQGQKQGEASDAKQAPVEAVDFTCGECGAVNRLPRDKVLNLKASPLCGRCEKPLLRAYDRPFDDLDPDSYIHPLDKETLDALKRIPGVSTLLRSLIRHSFELATRLHHHANFVRVGPTGMVTGRDAEHPPEGAPVQLPTLWTRFEAAARALGIKQLPELYVYQDPVPQAYTFGVDRYFIAISTGCLELLDDDEITVILAHELGPVHADHVLYKSAARVFGSVASTIVQATFGIGSLVVYPIQLALLRWDRASELSSDRAALIVVKNPQTVMRALMKVAGGTRRLGNELSIDAFIEQADSFGKMQDEGPLGRYITIFQTLFRSHPFPIWRTKEILDWVTTGNYLEILDGEYKTRAIAVTKACPSCGAINKADAIICSQCGHQLIDEPTGEEAARAVREVKEAAGVDDGTGDVVAKAWGEVRGWYKRNFTMEGKDEGPVVDADASDPPADHPSNKDA
jgi:Zn-dependent protease with chaperone function